MASSLSAIRSSTPFFLFLCPHCCRGQDHSHNGQEGLHAAAGELWLFGLAHAHVITRESHFGRLGALAGGRYGSMPRVYSLAKPYDRRSCR